MNMQRFHAADMSEACEAIRTELGPEAVIISSRKVKAGGLRGLRGREQIEVIAGVPGGDEARTDAPHTMEGVEPPPPPIANSGAAPPSEEGVAATDGPSDAVLARAKAALLAVSAERTERATGDGAASMTISAAAHQAAAQAAARPPDTAPASPGPATRQDLSQSAERAAAAAGASSAGEPEPAPAEASPAAVEHRMMALQAEIGELRRLVRAIAPKSARPEGVLPAGAQAVIERWRAVGVPEDLLGRSCETAAGSLEAGASTEAAIEAVERALREQLPSGRGPTLPLAGTTAVLVTGAPGSGKTVAAVKLALRLQREASRPVVLANADLQRPGAGQQLAAYGEALSLPTALIYTPSDLQAVAQEHPNAVIVVDTAGTDRSRPGELERCQALRAVLPRSQAYLVVDATMRSGDLERVYASLRGLRLSGLIATKGDATERGGELLGFLGRIPVPLVYASRGANVLEPLADDGPWALLERALAQAEEGRADEPLAS